MFERQNARKKRTQMNLIQYSSFHEFCPPEHPRLAKDGQGPAPKSHSSPEKLSLMKQSKLNPNVVKSGDCSSRWIYADPRAVCLEN